MDPCGGGSCWWLEGAKVAMAGGGGIGVGAASRQTRLNQNKLLLLPDAKYCWEIQELCCLPIGEIRPGIFGDKLTTLFLW